MQAHSRKQLAKWGWWLTHVEKMVGDAQPKGKLCGCSNGERTWANKKQHAKDGKMFKINVYYIGDWTDIFDQSCDN